MPEIALCIGAPRSGTTWLAKNLERHPDIFVPPIKEVRHFVGSPALAERQRMASNRPPSDWVDRWVALAPGDDGGYRDLMRSTDRPVSIDISPMYCTANRETVERIRSCLGSTRIVFLIRDPVAREYSQVKHYFHMQRRVAAPVALSEYLELLARPDFVLRSDYLRALDIWSEVFGQIHIEFYDDIETEPEKVLERITRFLGASYSPACYVETARNRVGAGARVRDVVPDALKPLLAARQMSNLLALQRRFPEKAGVWLENARRLVDSVS